MIRAIVLELKPLIESPLNDPALNVQMTYKLPWHGSIESVCYVSVWEDVVVITEPQDNSGVSVTNAIEYIASAVAHLWFLDRKPDRITWIEHYPPRGRVRPFDTWYLVRLQWTNKDGSWCASNPQWEPITIEGVYCLIKQSRSVSE